MNKTNSLRAFLAFLVIFFIVVTLLNIFIVIPKINDALKNQQLETYRTTIGTEKELLTRYITNHIDILKDLASFPVVANAALMSSSADHNFIDLAENFNIRDEGVRLIFQNITGDIIYQTKENLLGDYSGNAPQFEAILNANSDSEFQLIKQESDNFWFVISVPIKYRGNVEGVLSAEIVAPIKSIFSPDMLAEKEAFVLRQNDTIIQTDASKIIVPQETSVALPFYNLELIYISDYNSVLLKKDSLRNTIFIVLLIGLSLSFLLLVTLGHESFFAKGEIKPDKNMSYLLPASMALIGIIISITAAILINNLQKQAERENTLSNFYSYLNGFENRVSNKLTLLTSLKAFYDASDFISREEFKNFTQPLLRQHNFIQALEWIPKVNHDERVRYERLANQDGLSNFQIAEKAPDGSMIIADKRDIYYPVYYVEPIAGNENALGFDLASNPIRNAALQKAADSGKATATAPMTLVKDKEKQSSLLVINPIYDGHNVSNNIKGFVLIVLKTSELITSITEDNNLNAFICVQDVTEENETEIIFSNSENCTSNDNLISNKTFDVAGRKWKLLLFSKTNLNSFSFTFLSGMILIVGTILSLLLAYTFIQQIRRREIIEQLVEERTNEVANERTRLKSVLDASIDGLITIDSKGLIQSFNPAAVSIFGYKPEEVIGENIKILMPEPYHSEHDGYLHSYSKTGDKKIIGIGREVSALRKDGIIFPIELGVNEMQIGDQKMFVGTIHDITQRKQAEEEIMRSNVELQRFAYIASHDLQEPLRMVTSFTKLLKQKYADQLDETANEFIQFAYDAALRMQALVNDLLEYSRIGHEAENYIDVDMNDLLETVKSNLSDSISLNDATITHDFLPTVRANPVRLMRALQNLLGNAIKYQSPNTKPAVLVDAVKEEDYWKFSVTDNGIGMNPEYCEKIFEPFKRLHGQSEYSGTGIGLAICRRIIEGFGGKIWAESNQGVGSTFYFTIPAIADD